MVSEGGVLGSNELLSQEDLPLHSQENRGQVLHTLVQGDCRGRDLGWSEEVVQEQQRQVQLGGDLSAKTKMAGRIPTIFRV